MVIKWKCHNCDNVFESPDEEEFREDAKDHLIDCFEFNDFIERLS